MLSFIKKFFNRLLESDLAEHLVPPNNFISGKNFRIGATEKGGAGYIENILQNAEKSHTLPSGGTNIRIGFATDDENGFIAKFNYNSIGDHGIYLFDIISELWYTVLLDADVTGGLNFGKYDLINGAYIVNGILYFNDNRNEPRKLHLGAFISGYGVSPIPSPVSTNYVISYPIDDSEITLIRKPCAYPPQIIKSYDSGFVNNFIKDESYQFTERYIHFDGEKAVNSTLSQSSFLNTDSENYNYINVILDNTETIPQTVRLVQLIVKVGSTGKGFVVKEWDRFIASENADINAGSLTFPFFGDITGEPVDDADMAIPFHSVPLQSKSQERAKNRSILVNNLEGYDAPTVSSLALSLPAPISLGFTTLNKTLISIKHRRDAIFPSVENPPYVYSGWYVLLTEVSPSGYYAINGTETTVMGNLLPYPPLPPPPTTSAFSGLTFRGATAQAAVVATRPGTNQTTLTAQQIQTTGYPFSITGLTIDAARVYLPQSQYKASVTFYDRYLRKCSTVFSDDILDIPPRNYAFSNGYGSIDWTLSYVNALAEIPDWAYYYSVDRTLNLRTRYFLAAFDNETKYATRNAATGLLEFTSTTYGVNVVAIALNSKALLQANLGWTPTEGDQCILIDNSNNRYQLPIIGSEGEYFLLKPVDAGNLSGVTFVYEFYVPYKSSAQELFFQMGALYKITDPTTSLRNYETLFGSFRADTVAITRSYAATTYYAEAMCPNDTYFDRWDTDAGLGNLISKLGQVRYLTGLRFSNVYIQGTQTNGLSDFRALNREILPEDMGSLTKAILASKVQADGTVLIVIGSQEVASVYLGETQVFDAEGNSFLAKSTGFIGQINVLRGGYGCSNHESVILYKGRIAWFSLTKGQFVAYSGNEIFPISDNGLKRVSNLFSKKYATMSIAEIEALGSRPFVFGGVDPYFDEWLFSIPATEETPPKGYLEDYTFSEVLSKDIREITQKMGYGSDPFLKMYYYGQFVYLTEISPQGYYAIASTEAYQVDIPPTPSVPPSSITYEQLIFRGETIEQVLLNTLLGETAFTVLYANTDSGYNTNIEGTSQLPYPYDVYDGQAKVLVYCINQDQWGAPHEYQTEGFIDIRDLLFSASNGFLYKHNEGPAYNTFYDVAVISAIGMIINEQANIIKEYLTLSVEGNAQPTFVQVRSETPNIQSGEVFKWTPRNAVFYSFISRDRLSPNVTGTYDEKMFSGDRIIGPWIKVWVEFNTTGLLQIRYFNVGFFPEPGHKT